jgi:predicted metal-dependent phosphoesterase TrpH
MAAEAPRFDLQSHSTCSDGALEPAAVVAAAARSGVELLALTDHDSVAGVDAALAAARREGVRLVPAAELSTIDELGEDLHLLGYGIDHHDSTLAEALLDFREDRARRINRMADALDELGLGPDRAVLRERRAAGLSVGRPHLAQAAVATHRARLAERGLDEPSAFLEAYLIPGRPAYRRRTTPTVPEAIDLVHGAGGVAVWAHPFWDVDEPADVLAAVERFAGHGLDGVEAFYVTHDRAQTELLADAAARFGLLSTGSADFHGPDHLHFSRFRAFELHGLRPRLGPIGRT